MYAAWFKIVGPPAAYGARAGAMRTKWERIRARPHTPISLSSARPRGSACGTRRDAVRDERTL